MSLSWLDRLLPAAWQPRVLVLLHPQRIRWSRFSAGFKPRQLAQGSLRIAHTDRDIAPLLALLPQALQQADVAGARVEIVLSSDFVRYAIVPNPDGAANAEELALLCRHAFQRVHGDIVAEWDIQLSLAALGGNGLASAVDQALLATLIQQVAEEKSRLVSVQPVLAQALNHLASKAADGIVVLREPGRLCLLAWQDRQWAAVQQHPAADDWQAVLQARLHRLRLQLDMAEDTPVQVCDVSSDAMQPRTMPWHAQPASSMAGAGA